MGKTEEHETGLRRCNYVLDSETLRLLQLIREQRLRQAGVTRGRWAGKSQIVREAIKGLYEFEVLEQSRRHPKDRY